MTADLADVYEAEKAAWDVAHPEEPFPPFVVWLYFHLESRRQSQEQDE